MKIIDLLNKIAKREQPQKIKYDDMIWKYDNGFYINKNYVILDDYCNLTAFLNDEVEILEEEKKIPEKLDWNKNDFTYPEGNLMSEEIADMLMEIQDKVNFILDDLKSKGE